MTKRKKDSISQREMKANSLVDILCKDAQRFIREGSAYPPPKLTPEEFQHAQEVSKSATRRPEEVPMTPLLKHMLEEAGVIKEDERLLNSSPETSVEKWLQEFCRAGIEELFHSGLPEKYDQKKGPADPTHYVVDCVRNIPSNFRHQWVEPKRTLEESVDAFRKPYPKVQMKFFDYMRTPAGKKALDYLNSIIPRVSAETQFKLTALPFEHRDSNVGLKDARNARLLVPGTKMTYGQKAVATAEKLSLAQLKDYNGYILFARFQRGSERNIMGSSAVVNSSLNRLTGREIEMYKRVPLYVGYCDEDTLKRALIKKTEFCEAHGYMCMNYDQTHYDSNISPEMKAFVDAFLKFKAVGRLGKDVAEFRGLLGQMGWIITPWEDYFVRMWARMFSGEIQTNKNESMISCLTNVGCSIEQDPAYCTKILYVDEYAVIAMGDDINIDEDPTVFSIDEHIRKMKRLGLEVHPIEEKGEFGAFFLQFRLIRDAPNHYIMVRPFPRVIRSLLFREQPVGLGPAGWTFAFWSILSGLIEYPRVLSFVVHTVLGHDREKLGTTSTVSDLIARVNEEDKLALEKDPVRGRTTGDILYDGDPQKAEFFDTTGDHVRLRESPYLTRIWSAVKAAAESDSPEYTAAIQRCPFPKP
jgi:hypothetical protein